jgi:hypothetical protein
MARARQMTAAEAAQERQQRARKDVEFATLLRATHRRLRLWRLCRRDRCKRARGCCGDVIACGARRWPVVRAFFQQMIDTRGIGLTKAARRRAARQRLREWSDDGTAVRRLPQVVTFRWMTEEEAARAGGT